jgi:hypothetical protein
MRAIVFGLMLSLSALIAGRAFAGASCDATIEKAKGKLVSCECGAQAKGALAGSLAKCEGKFQKACSKAKTIGGCTVQTESCAVAQSESETFVTQHCVGSASGAFLE